MNDKDVLKSVWHHLWPSGRLDLRVRVVVSFLCLVGAKAFTIWTPFFYKAAVDQLSQAQALIVVPVVMVVSYALARVMAQLLSELRDSVFAKVTQHAVRQIALQIFRHLHALSLRFHLERQTGGVSRIIERGSQGLQTLLSFMLFNIMPTIIEIALVCGVLFYKYSIWFGVLTGLTILVYVIFTFVVSEWRVDIRKNMNLADTEANTKAVDSLLNYETVKYFNNEGHESKRFDVSLQRYEVAAIKAQTSLAFLNIGQGFIITAGLVGVMILAAVGVSRGTQTVGDFVLVNTFLLQLYLPLNFLGFVYRQAKQSIVDISAMMNMLNQIPEVVDKEGAPELVVSGGALQFQNVEFAYDERRPVLKGISFSVPAGKTLAIVGASGSGKSTITRLLYRFYDVNAGQISVDGQDIRAVAQGSLRQIIGIVPQDTVLFNDTILYNIRYGRPDASDDDVFRAAKLAQIHGFIESLPEGYQSMVGERGLKLSGGEKQRVAIARTILKDPAVLIFDEATSALDTHTEKEIQKSLSLISKNKTTIMIAHRLSTVIDADHIIVLEQGSIVEEGRHAQLIKADGHYAKMWAKQQELQEYEEKVAELKDVE